MEKWGGGNGVGKRGNAERVNKSESLWRRETVGGGEEGESVDGGEERGERRGGKEEGV